jgi:hypothetical protein
VSFSAHYFWAQWRARSHELDSPEQMVGAPLSLQVVAGRWEDEKAVLALQLIDAVLHSR